LPKSNKISTKDKILATALKMFNETSTQASTTNHIAAEMGISPGNLHYHFKNREEIVRTLYHNKNAESILSVDKFPSSIVELLEHQKMLNKVFWKYRFFQRELSILLFRDPAFKEEYIKDNISHRTRIIAIYKNLVENGDLHVRYDNELEHLADMVLLVVQYYISFCETMGHAMDYSCIENSLSHIQGAIRPYLTEQALKTLAESKNS